MRVEHLIDGRPVAGSSYFETVDPATQEVLAEVARGGAAEVDAAVMAAKRAFPAWAKTPPAERARLMRRLGDLIAAHVPALSETETRDTGQVIAQTRKQLVPRAADNFHYFAEVCTRVDGHTYPTPTHLNYTLYQPVGVCALISPWNVPFMTLAPGDVILTGTPEGVVDVGVGDEVVCEIEGLGRLVNRIAGDAEFGRGGGAGHGAKKESA